MIDSERVGRAIRTLRIKAGYTQKELADQLFVSSMAVSKWERGKSVPDPSTLIKLSAILDMDVDGLLDGTATYSGNHWRGILLLDSAQLHADALLYDKPLIDYQISYFLLAGVRNLLIVCREPDRTYIRTRFRDGASLGIRLEFSEPDSLIGCTALQNTKAAGTDILLLSQPFFLYGVDLSRFLQRAMQNKSPVVNLASVVGHGSKLKEGFSHYEYQSVPLYFVQGSCMAEEGDLPFSELPLLVRENKRLRAEPMDKGFVLSLLQSRSDAEAVSSLIRCIQELGSYLIYCPLEIAWRRGMIGREAMYREAEGFPEYREYLKNL